MPRHTRRVSAECRGNMTAPSSSALQGRAVLMLVCVVAAGAVAVVGSAGGAGIGDYEYDYDTLPRVHLRRSARSAARAARAAPQEHVQHVPAHAPPAPTAGDSVVQRVPRQTQPGAAPATTAAPEVQPAAPEPPAPSGGAERPAPQDAEPATELQPPPRVESSAEDLQEEQAPQVPAAIPDLRLAKALNSKDVASAEETTSAPNLDKDDMETANFFWGLGAVYPHLYVYRRVPHLVPLHGWNPYHAYILTHPAK